MSSLQQKLCVLTGSEDSRSETARERHASRPEMWHVSRGIRARESSSHSHAGPSQCQGALSTLQRHFRASEWSQGPHQGTSFGTSVRYVWAQV